MGWVGAELAGGSGERQTARLLPLHYPIGKSLPRPPGGRGDRAGLCGRGSARLGGWGPVCGRVTVCGRGPVRLGGRVTVRLGGRGLVRLGGVGLPAQRRTLCLCTEARVGGRSRSSNNLALLDSSTLGGHRV